MSVCICLLLSFLFILRAAQHQAPPFYVSLNENEVFHFQKTGYQ